jgi:hypothetical protein
MSRDHWIQLEFGLLIAVVGVIYWRLFHVAWTWLTALI